MAPKPGVISTATAAVSSKPPADPAHPQPGEDVPNDTLCDNPQAAGNCGHPASMHGDTAMAQNDGACTAPGCDCSGMVVPDSDDDGQPGGTPTDPKPAAPVVAPKAGPPVAAPTPGKPKKGVNPFPKKGAAVDRIEFNDEGVAVAFMDDGSEIALAAVPGVAAPVDAPETVVPSDANNPLAFTIPVMVVEGITTGDRRSITPGALTTRPLPMALMAVTSTSSGHDGAQLVGRIDSCERYDASALIDERTGEPYGEGVFAWSAEGVFNSLEFATEVAGLIREKFLRGVSVDMSDVTSVLEFLDADGNPIDDSALGDDEWISFDAMQENVTAGRLMGCTICPFPAFEGAYIVVGDAATPQVDSTDALAASAGTGRRSMTFHDEFGGRDCAACDDGRVLVASAGPMAPPSAWFANPGFTEATPLTVTEDGRVYGHLATWGTCHTGVSDSCTLAPKSRTNYGHYRLKSVLTAEGDLVSTGTITMGTGHAPLHMNVGETMAHYDNTGTAVADVAAGEDQYGIWIAGATRPDVTDLQIRTLRASALSGDWRRVGGNLELMATLAVNVPGFPVVRQLTASGAPMALVAAGGRGAIKARTEYQAEQANEALAAAIARMDAFIVAGTIERARAKMERVNR